MTEPKRRPTLKELLVAQEPEWLVLGAGSKVLGPVPQVMLLKAVLRGGLDETTLVRPVGQPQWRPVRDHARLRAALARVSSRPSGIHTSTEQATSQPASGTRTRRLSPPPRPRASGE